MIESLVGLERIHNAFDAVADELKGRLGVPLCIPGCGKCCETVLAHRIEAIFAISSSIGEGKIERVLDLTESWLLDRHKEAPTYEGPQFGELKPRIVQEFWALTGVPCPFLTSDKSCYIYRGRPMVCYAYGVTHMPGPTPDYCPRRLGKGEVGGLRAYADVPGLKMMVTEFISTLPDPDWRVVGFLPAIIFKQLKPDKYRAYIEDNKIASAKLVGLPMQFPGMLWQEEMEGKQAVYA